MDPNVKVEEPGAAQPGPSAPPAVALDAAPKPEPPQPDPAALKAAAEAAARAAAEAEARRAAEAAALKAAAEVRDRRAWARVQPYNEGKRVKTHWDHLLDEMSWLSKEFQRERRWKLQQARKAANAVARSNLDLESRVEVRARETEKALRKRASWIAREVAAFWGKAQRVVAFRIKTEVEAKKKEVLDRQLDALLGQTQKYSSLLAARLAVDERADAVVAASKAEPVPAPGAPPAAPAGADGAGPSGVRAAEGGGDAAGPSRPPRPPAAVPRALPPSAAVSGTAPDADDSKDYRSGEDDDADDEATLEEEEAMARAEGLDLDQDQKEEAAGLADDADLPLEQLLARYGYVMGGGDDAGVQGEAMDVDEAGPSAPAAAGRGARRGQRYSAAAPAEEDEDGSDGGGADAESDAESEKLEALLREPAGAPLPLPPPPPSRLAAEFADLSDEEGAGSVDAGSAEPSSAGPSTRRGRSAAATAAAAKPGAAARDDEDEYRSGEDDDADDEATLEEEEALARAEGLDLDQDQKEEAAGLADDADLPLEELLARYGYVMGGAEQQEAAPAAAEAAEAPAAGGRRTRGRAAAAAPAAPSTDAGADGEDEAPPPGGIAGTMEAMAAAQPTGFTLATTKVKTPVPFLLKGQLREYQHIGLDWLVTLYHRRLNGILADEMGLGKTIQTIALLAWLACERGDWGPHLVVVPTSVMLNWEMEFKRWCPAFKLLTYYGSPKERAAKRQGWSKPNAFHVCITSYTLVLQDARMFKRKKWKYLILDEAHMIKNWRSQRWQTLLNFSSKRRLLITGTPLQNDLMELWSLMHFLMPQVFGSHAQFKDWFSNPLTGMVEGSAEYNTAIVDRLHAVLRPFLLRRLKRDVEKQLPGKHEHVVRCRLSKRQRQLYEEYMASGDTRATLASGNFLGIMNCLMQLRKVCNHPDLFEGRPIISAYDAPPLELRLPSAVVDLFERRGRVELLEASERRWADGGELRSLGLVPVADGAAAVAGWEATAVSELALGAEAFSSPATTPAEDVALLLGRPGAAGSLLASLRRTPGQAALAAVAASVQALAARRRAWRSSRTTFLGALSLERTARRPGLTAAFAVAAAIDRPAVDAHAIAAQPGRHLDVSDALLDMVLLPDTRAERLDTVLREFTFVIPRARAPAPQLWCSHPDASAVAAAAERSRALSKVYAESSGLLHVPRMRTALFFPDKRLIQYDCGKLQEMASLLLRLKAGGHRALIFTQMSKMLDVLEAFLNIHAYTYVRLDGATKPEQRQVLAQRFNTDPRIFCFILSTRSGGVGMNLTGADTVIFYDSDWNPAMDAQAQDRCHRIGQTREVHIYRLVSEHTIEENILKKSDQKRQLDWLAIQSGGFTTDFLQKFDPSALLEGAAGGGGVGDGSGEELAAAMRAAEDEGDAAAAVAAEREVAAEMDEFIKEPPPGAVSEAGDDENGPAPSEAGTEKKESDATAAAVAATAADDEGFADVAALAAGGGADGGDPLAQLQAVLRPIERYAVRWVEAEAPAVDPDAVAAAMEAEYQVNEFDVDAIEAAEEEREAEIDEDEEANIVGDWDQGAATAAYAQQVEAAEAEEKRRAEEEAKWLEAYQAQYGTLPPPVEPSVGASGGGRGRGRGRGRPPAHAAVAAAGPSGTSWMGDEAGDTAVSPAATGARGWGGAAAEEPAPKRRRTTGPPPLPWEPAEDFVLSSVVAQLLEAGELPGPGLWTAAADALGAGAAATSVAGVDAAARQGRRRTADACARRYAQLRGAFAAVSGTSGTPEKECFDRGVAEVKAAVGAALGATTAPGSAAEALAAAWTALAIAAQISPLAATLMAAMHALRGAAAAGALAAPPPSTGAFVGPVAGPLSEAQAIAAAVRQGCGTGAARVIAARLPAVIEAARAGDVLAGLEEALGADGLDGMLGGGAVAVPAP